MGVADSRRVGDGELDITKNRYTARVGNGPVKTLNYIERNKLKDRRRDKTGGHKE